MASVAAKVSAIFRKRGVILLVVSAISAVIAAKGGPPPHDGLGFWDGPS